MGAYIARRLHEDGRNGLLTDVDTDAVEALAAELSPDGATARGIRLDVASRDDFVAGLEACQRLWGTPTIVVNNAAVTQAADLMTLGADEFNRVLTTNVDSAFFGCQVFGAAMARQGFGRIVNMASLAGQNGGTATGGHYAASKGAILTVTKIFAQELAAKGVTVNAIAPGPHDLPVVQGHRSRRQARRGHRRNPGGPVGKCRPSSRTWSALLTSDDAFFVTGACWDVNGGLYVR